MKHWSTQRFTVSQVVNNSARVDVKSLRGPVKVAGSYSFTSRLSGVTNLSAFTRDGQPGDLPQARAGERGPGRPPPPADPV